MSIGPLDQFAYPGVYTRTFFLPGVATSARGAGARYPAIIAEVPANSEALFRVVKGGGVGSQAVIDEEQLKPDGAPSFDGVINKVKAVFWPLASKEVFAKIDGFPIEATVVSDADQAKGLITLAQAPLPGQVVQISYESRAEDVLFAVTGSGFSGATSIDLNDFPLANFTVQGGANDSWLTKSDFNLFKIADGKHTSTSLDSADGSVGQVTYVDNTGTIQTVSQLRVLVNGVDVTAQVVSVDGEEGRIVFGSAIADDNSDVITIHYFAPVYEASSDVIPVAGFVELLGLYEDAAGKRSITAGKYVPGNVTVGGNLYGKVSWEHEISNDPGLNVSLKAVKLDVSFPAAASNIFSYQAPGYAVLDYAGASKSYANPVSQTVSTVLGLTKNIGASGSVAPGQVTVSTIDPLVAGSYSFYISNFVGGEYTVTKPTGSSATITKSGLKLWVVSSVSPQGFDVLGYTLTSNTPASILVQAGSTADTAKINGTDYPNGKVITVGNALVKVKTYTGADVTYTFNDNVNSVSVPVEGLDFSSISALASGTYVVNTVKVAPYSAPSAYYAKVKFARPVAAYSKKTCFSLKEVEDYAGVSSKLYALAKVAMANGAPQLAVKPVAEGALDSDYTAAFADFVDPMLDDNGSRPITFITGSTSPAVHGFAKSWILEQTNWVNQNEANYIAGFAADTKVQAAKDFASSGAASSRYVVAVWPPVVKFEGAFVAGEYMAAAVAGATTSKSYDLGTSLTGKSLTGIEYGYRTFRPQEEGELSEAGISVYRRVGSTGLRCGLSLTTDVTDELTREPRITEQSNFYQRELRARLDVFKGRKKLPGLERTIQQSVEAYFKGKKRIQEITEIGPITVKTSELDPTTYEVEAFYKPMFSVNWILVTLNVSAVL